MDRLHGMNVFLRVVEAGNLSAAARALGVSPAAVSAAIARLESELGARLLARTTRRLSPTPEGADFYARCKQIMADLDDAERAVGRVAAEPTGRLRVSMPATLGRMAIIPALPRFRAAYPGIALEVVCSDFVPYAMEDGIDLSVQVGELHPSSLAVRRLASTRYTICAAPDYLRQREAPKTPEDLAGHTCITYRRPRNGRMREWRIVANGAVRHLRMNGAMTFNSGEALAVAASAGLGVIQVADYYVRDAIERGALVELLTDYAAPAYDIYAVFPRHERTPPKLRVFVDFLVEIFGVPPWAARRAGVAKRVGQRVGRGGR